jgi:hypothetical protein
MTLIKTTLFIFTLGLASCCSSTKTSNEVSLTNESAMTLEQMEEAGYTKGTIVSSEAEGDCPYVIALEDDSSRMFDPINLENTYKKNGTKIWFKYTGLRMMNRCEKANPVTITEIQKRM